MLSCSECGTEHYPGALFCRECGAPLHSAAQTIGRPLPGLGSKAADAPPTSAPPVPLAKGLLQPGSGEKRLRMVVPSAQNKTVALRLAGVIWIGRADSSAAAPPEIDLSAFQGYERGVSRRHATIEWCVPGAVLIDRNSSNGSWLNGHRLQPGEPYLLPAHAQVRFGNLLVYLMIGD